MSSRYGGTVDDLERSARVPVEDQVEEQPVRRHDGPVPPEELERLQNRFDSGG